MPEKTFEKAMERLEEIVKGLEGGALPLDASLKAFEEGMKLVQFCSGKLEEAQKKVALLVKEGEERFRTVPFDREEDGDA
ncbi:exodeoxyribonuclease VII small subunit [Desulfatiglans anilini]|uniref:exodeoxyribonuclease VII small subunit n=1 Tax=Desulfatiglans anilini TaxID=90728 RepID=UPI0003FA5642|nr:exodeoxyribonuclease VII small subunit [Desulfatiglans anilini]VBB42069.1 Exodeoxyribonuclease 7 small subunit [uncultured Desulfatiglans sp.]